MTYHNQNLYLRVWDRTVLSFVDTIHEASEKHISEIFTQKIIAIVKKYEYKVSKCILLGLICFTHLMSDGVCSAPLFIFCICFFYPPVDGTLGYVVFSRQM